MPDDIYNQNSRNNISNTSKIIDEKAEAEIRRIFGNLVSPVKLIFFTQQNACPTCVQQLELLKEVTTLSEKLKLEVYDFVLHGDAAISYKINKIPATAVIGEKDYGIRFYGLTVGYEFTSLLEAIIMVSTGVSGLDPKLEELGRGFKEQIHIQVFATLTCPYCPKMVHVAHQFAFVNPNICADMVEASEFPQLVQRYNVSGVPKTIINDNYSFEGALPPEATYLEILKAVNPEEYSRLKESVREIQGKRKTRRAEENHVYETIIVGGGPAAMSSAIYLSRKGLDVAIIGKKLGGQITYTGSIENYLGFASISGSDLTEAFRSHLENYPVSEAFGLTVVQIKKLDDTFAVYADGNRQFKALTLIYCAGDEYRRLGVPEEERFIGKGIGFCATCDAPLYQDKRVAVIGGGNSAFTAARDLIGFASEIHMIHWNKDFTADATLIQEIQKAENVTFHTQMIVRSFLGEERLTGVRLESTDGRERFDLNVDGVFLEIGLTPNTSPLKGLIELNKNGEVPVNKDQSTFLAGLFAAGDVTDVEEKQISIAVGQGALAALTAYKYLVLNGLTQSKKNYQEQ